MDADDRVLMRRIAVTNSITLDEARANAAESDQLVSEIRDNARRMELLTARGRDWWQRMAEALEDES